MMQPAQETSAVRTTESSWRTSLRAIARKAVTKPNHRFGGLYRLLNEANLRECFFHLRKAAAPGVDGVTVEEYAKNLDENLRSLVQRLKDKSYRAGLVRRKYIPKGEGKMRPLGIPTLEDKLVQYAVAQILSAIYEANFFPWSYGYREGRSAHDAIRDLTDTLFRGQFEFVVEADIKGFFDHIQHHWLVRMLAERIDDEAMLRLVGKWLLAGILEEDGRVEHPATGTPQGGIVSPVLANVYLHYALDLWFERRVRRTNRGQSRMFRYADDFVCAFDYRHEADAFVKALGERLSKFGLELAPDKTHCLRFGRGGGEHNGRFDFLGFEFSWGKSRTRGHRIVQRRTSRKKLRAAVSRFTEWIKSHRCRRLGELMETVAQKYRGHWSYYGIIGNSPSLAHYWWATTTSLFNWLNRRSQRSSLKWPSFQRVLERYRVPPPRIMEKVQGVTERPSRPMTGTGQESGVNLLGAFYVACRA
jgi:group II intron reverse transcriptase/maturase